MWNQTFSTPIYPKWYDHNTTEIEYSTERLGVESAPPIEASNRRLSSSVSLIFFFLCVNNFFFWLVLVFCDIDTDDKNYEMSMVSKMLKS